MNTDKVLNKKGVTLIELIFVTAVIAILVGLAFTKFYIYKKNFFDGLAVADLRNAANAQEGFFVNNQFYRTCSNNGCVSGINAIEGLQAINPGTTLNMVGTAISFEGNATHASGSGKIHYYDSENNGLQP